MTKQHREYKILRQNFFGCAYEPTPPKCTVSHCANGPGWPLWQINSLLLIAQLGPIMTQDACQWSGMTCHGSRGVRGHRATFASKKMINQQYMAPDYGLKYPRCVHAQTGPYLSNFEAFGAIGRLMWPVLHIKFCGPLLWVFPKSGTTRKHFLTHFFNFGHKGAPNVTKINYDM